MNQSDIDIRDPITNPEYFQALKDDPGKISFFNAAVIPYISFWFCDFLPLFLHIVSS